MDTGTVREIKIELSTIIVRVLEILSEVVFQF